MPDNRRNRNSASKNNQEVFEQLAALQGNVPPQALDLEAAVLGAMMLEDEIVISVQEFLPNPDAFYDQKNRIIYKAILDLSSKLSPTDLFTVTERLKAEGHLEEAGGVKYLTRLTQLVGSAANVEHHAKIIAQKYVQRELITKAIEIQKRSYDSSNDVTDLIGFAEEAIYSVSDGSIKKAVATSEDVLARTMRLIEQASKNDSLYNGVRTGFNALDKVTMGWQPSDLIIVAARPSMGKTAFVLTMARNMAVDFNQTVAFFSLEMSAEQLMMRLLVAETGIEGNVLKTGKLSPQQWTLLESKSKPLGHCPLYIDDTPALGVFEFRSKVRRLANKGLKIIIIDYLQLMTVGVGDSKGNREQEVSLISRTLKAIAKELNVPIIALSQLSRQTETRGGNHRPMLSDLRESGAIEQDADIVAFINRPEYFGLMQTEDGRSTAGLAEIILAKHRNGAVCDVPMRFIKEQARFADIDDLAPAEPQYDEYASGANSPIPAEAGGADGGFGGFDPSKDFNVGSGSPF